MSIFRMMGFTAALGTMGLGADYSMQTQQAGPSGLDFATYAQALSGRATNLMEFEKPRGARIARLPQVRNTSMQTTSMGSFSSDVPTAEEFRQEMRQDPLLATLLDADEKASKESFWSKVRRKFGGTDQQGQRLSELRERNYPARVKEFNPEELANMSPAEIAANMGEIRAGAAQLAADNIKNMGELE